MRIRGWGAVVAITFLLVASPIATVAAAGNATAGSTTSDVSAATTGENWPNSGHDNANTGYSPSATAPTADPEVAWTHNGSTGEMRMDVAVLDGTVYVAGGENGWQPNEMFYALDGVTGEEQWAAPFDLSYSKFTTSPTVVDGTIYVGTACDTCSGDYREALLALDQSSGDVEWSYEPVDVRGAPKVSDGGVYFGTDDRFVAADSETGTVKWLKEADGSRTDFLRAPAVHDGVVYVSEASDEDIHLYAYDEETGEELWKTMAYEANCCGTREMSAPVVANGKVFVGTHGAQVKAFDVETGEELWVNEDVARVTHGLAVAGDTVYGADESGTAFALRTSDGEMRWEQPLPGDAHAAPSIANGVVYVGDDSGQLHALDADDGHRLWALKVDGEIHTTPVPYQGRLYFSSDENVYAVQGEVNESYGDGVTYGVVDHNAELLASPAETVPGESTTIRLAGNEHVEYADYDLDADGSYDQIHVAGDESIEHTYDTAGSYDVEARVTYTDGVNETLTATVTVGEADTESESTGDTAEDGESNDDTSGDGGASSGFGPGFTVTVALVALVAAALIAARDSR